MAGGGAISGGGDHRDAEGPVLRVRLLGGVDLQLGETAVPPLDSARAESLLAYLLLNRDAPQQRQHLAFTLWPDSTESQARTNLRHVLHNLRRALPDADRFIDAGPRTLQWRRGAPMWLDVAAFEQAVAESRLRDAVGTYGGDLLEGNYDEWVAEERQRLSQLYLDALERLAKELEARGRFADAIRHGEQLLRRDPLREESYRLLIGLYAASGDRAAALRTYHACATSLVRELGVEPSAATREAYDALLAFAPEAQPAQRPPASPARSPLVGRGAERERLAELWRAAEGGRAQLVLVAGEAGIGKSRLVEELRSWCAHRGAVIADARSYPAEGAMAYGGLVTWLRCEPIAARLRHLAPAHLTELARLLPDLLSEVPGLAPPEPLPEDEQRQRLVAAAGRAMLADELPVLLIADDLQWSDLQTLRFIHYLLRAEPEAPLLVAATARREDLRGPANEVLAALQGLGAASEIELERLSRDETVLLAERIADRPLTGDEAERLYEDSEGVPLFLVEALRAGPAAAIPVPEEMSDRVRAVIASRLARLSQPAADLVGVAATIGREFTVQVLADASRASEEALVRGLDELWRRAIVRARGPNAYDFSHGKIREAACAALSPATARHHHLRVAEALNRSQITDLDAASGRIATHYEAAGAIEDAIGWYLRAAEASQRLHASADAVRFLERALGVLGRLPAGAERDTLELSLLTQLPAPLVAVEGYLSDRVTEVHDRALELASALGVNPAPPLARSLAMATLTRGEFEAAIPFGDHLRARAEREGDDVLWVESAYVLGVAEYWQGHLERARAHFEDAVARYRPEHQSAHLLSYGQDPRAFCEMRLAHTLWLIGRAREANRARDAALDRAEHSGHPYTRVATGLWAAVVALDQRDDDRLRLHAESPSEDEALGGWQLRTFFSALAGLLDVLDGRGPEGIERAGAAFESARGETSPAPGSDGILARILLETCARAEDHEAGLAAAAEALEVGGGAQLWEAEIRRLRAEFLAALGAASGEVEFELQRALEVAGAQGARSFELRAHHTRDRLLTGQSRTR